MSRPKILTDAIGCQLKPAGFKKKASTWYIANNETISLLNLQKSAYGPQYYVNIAVWLRVLGDAETPKEHECHVRMRWESVVPVDEKHLARLLDLEDSSIPDSERSGEIEHLVRDYVLPFFSRVSSLAGLRFMNESNSWPTGSLVHRKARELLFSCCDPGEH